ncbi:uncharacterized protein LOC142238657 [Haematobia irritans]|uniref:uncharacterized protein LOC142238657 n=1 Tax=Haematobia irritans TaxID=7368 RepID=UPI003F4F5B82
MAHWKLPFVSKLLILSLCCTFACGTLVQFLGIIGDNSVVIYTDYVNIGANKTKPVTVKYDRPNKRIDAIRIADFGKPGSYAHYYLREGGPGYFNATIEITSEKYAPVHAEITYFRNKK